MKEDCEDKALPAYKCSLNDKFVNSQDVGGIHYHVQPIAGYFFALASDVFVVLCMYTLMLHSCVAAISSACIVNSDFVVF